MTTPMTAAIYMQKATRTLEEAWLLLQEKATEGACNRAYYAMFAAAHAAMMAAGHEVAGDLMKSHQA